MLVGPAVFLIITALGRAAAFGAAAARASRSRALVLIGIPGNVGLFADHSNGAGSDLQLGYKKIILSVGRLPVSREVPRSKQIDPTFAEDLTVGWLLDGVDSGRGS
jgi:hypothetical protein